MSDRAIDGVRIQHDAAGLRITRSWSRAAGYATLAWIVLWFGLVAFFTSLGKQSATGPRLVLALPGIAMAYVAATRFVNRTVIDVGASHIVLRHAPLPWPGNRRFAIRDVSALRMKVKRIHAKGHSVDEHWIYVVRANGEKAMLVKGLEMSMSQMSGIAGAISDYLGVPLSSD